MRILLFEPASDLKIRPTDNFRQPKNPFLQANPLIKQICLCLLIYPYIRTAFGKTDMQGLAWLKVGGLAHHLTAAVGDHAETARKDVLG